ncbi:MAG: urease accessory UreF family protein [Methylacidiphilaceae bacterium]|nr:urease accessory UreF family protein [Candidatus Methylacidiphilaceae bacterium]
MLTESLCSRLGALLQTSDSAYPLGTFSHSFGLEGLRQMGEVESTADLKAQLHRTFVPMLLHVDLPLLARAREATEKRDWSALQKLDRLSAALRWSSEQRKAAGRMGARRLKLLESVHRFPAFEEPFASIAASLSYTQACVVAGAESSLLAIPTEASAVAFAYQTLAGIILAGVRLLRISPIQGQRLLRESVEAIVPGIDRGLGLRDEELGWFAPSFDIAAARHARAEERQFLS